MERLVFLTIIFNVLFPKAGTKINNIPIYIGVILSLFVSIKVYINKINIKTKKEYYFYTITILIFIINFLIPYLLDINDIKISWVIIAIYTIIIYPSIFFIPLIYRKIGYIRLLKISLIILLGYGYLQKIFGDYNVVIPGITANYSEAMTTRFLHQKKNFLHALGILKITSTYQNGNLFGLNITLIFWTVIIYFRKLARIIVSILFLGVIILTGSASSYFGNVLLLLIIIFNKLVIKKEKNILIIILLTFSLIFIIINVFDFDIFEILRKRLFQRDIMSGSGRFKLAKRSIELNYFYFRDYLFGKSLVTGGFNEMIIITTFLRFGIFGLILFSIRNFIFYNFKIPLKYYYGIIGFLFNSLFDAAIFYPPVYFNYFFVLGVIELEYIKRRKLKYKKLQIDKLTKRIKN